MGVNPDLATSSGWSAVLAAKRLEHSKSRLRPVLGVGTADLVAAMFEDTLTAVADCPLVDRLVVVTSDPTLSALADFYGAVAVPDPGQGLNEAFSHGADRLEGPDGGVVYLPGDLPCATGEFLSQCLATVARDVAAVVPDLEGTGTTMLIDPVRGSTRPHFGPNSYHVHVDQGARPVEKASPALRRDVDTPADLARALRLGAGRFTVEACLRLGRPTWESLSA